MVIKLVLSFPVLPSSHRERERERGWGLFALLLLYYMNCFNVCFLFMLHVFNASSSLCHGMVCGLYLWYVLVTHTCFSRPKLYKAKTELITKVTLSVICNTSLE